MRGKTPDMIGKRFNRLTVLQRVPNDRKGNSRWLCRCDCGTMKEVAGKDLLSGNVRSCGCLRDEINHRYEDLAGKRFGRLVVLKLDHVTPSGHTYWKCRCDCGNITACQRSHLIWGVTKSCGCYRHEVNLTSRMSRTRRQNERPHLLLPSAFRNAYRRMVDRCYNPNNSSYELYHGKGITVCKEWYDPDRVISMCRDDIGLAQFTEDMYSEYLKHLAVHGKSDTTLDRIDCTKGYSRDNCRWATQTVQNNNKTDNRHIFDNEEILTFSECVRKYIRVPLTGSYKDRPGNYITAKLEREWAVDQILHALKHYQATGVYLSKREVGEYLIRHVDQSVIYLKYPDEPRFPEYEDLY